MDSLKSKHRTKYTVLQLQIWAQLISSDLYTSTEEPPCNNSMFQRAGDSSSSKKQDSEQVRCCSSPITAFTQVLTGATKTVPLPSGQRVSTSSPATLINSRSKLYKQLFLTTELEESWNPH